MGQTTNKNNSAKISNNRLYEKLVSNINTRVDSRLRFNKKSRRKKKRKGRK